MTLIERVLRAVAGVERANGDAEDFATAIQTCAKRSGMYGYGSVVTMLIAEYDDLESLADYSDEDLDTLSSTYAAVLSYGAWAHGDRELEIAVEWHESGFDAYTWLELGVWDCSSIPDDAEARHCLGADAASGSPIMVYGDDLLETEPQDRLTQKALTLASSHGSLQDYCGEGRALLIGVAGVVLDGTTDALVGLDDDRVTLSGRVTEALGELARLYEAAEQHGQDPIDALSRHIARNLRDGAYGEHQVIAHSALRVIDAKAGSYWLTRQMLRAA